MSKHTTKCKKNRRFAKWMLRLPLGWRIVTSILIVVGAVSVVLCAAWVVEEVYSEIAYPSYEHFEKCLNGGYNQYRKDGEYYIRNREETKPAVRHVDWVVGNEGDSLWVVSRAGRRAYFNTASGRLVGAFDKRHAWVYSEGLAAVVDTNGWLRFIDPEGKPAMEVQFPYCPQRGGAYVFHHGLCRMVDTSGRFGLIDRSGRWVVEPQYDSVYHKSGFWALCGGDSLSVTDSAGHLVLGPNEAHELRVTDLGDLELWHRTRPARLYSPDGTLKCSQAYYLLHPLFLYENDESVRTRMFAYATQSDHYGLVDEKGHVLTDAIYREIEPVSLHLFRAEFDDDVDAWTSTAYVLLDEKGRVVTDR